MDWDDVSPKPRKSAVIGENLADFSVDELQVRLAALRDEIARVEAELSSKRQQSEAAAKLFKS